MTEAKVLNGTVSVGDRVAYAVRDGNCAGMRVGEVVEVRDMQRTYRKYDPEAREVVELPFFKLRVKVDLSDSGWIKPGTLTLVGNLECVVKL